ncbi:MAG: RluA family pseudouridine synthase [Deltaproteobacteria bacterium]|nr:RluA family pseudouridine synthase [Deltaproteobacteria bacterium]
MEPATDESFQFTVAEHEAGQRLDRYLATRQLRHSRSQVKRYLDAGYCSVNGSPARPAQKLKQGDLVCFQPPPPEPDHVEPEAIDIAVLYEDHELVVIDKAAGMVVHPGAGHRHGTLVAALLNHCTELSGVGGRLRPGIVHRIDRLTSGVMVATKTDVAHQSLSAQFKSHTIDRCYQAVVAGQPPEQGTFETLHGRHPTDRKRFSSKVKQGRRAVTHYRTLRRLDGATLVEARLETGRTHQVRVHFADAGYPLLGDPIYGRPPRSPRARAAASGIDRQALHAASLAFSHPTTGERLSFSSPLPNDMRSLINALLLPDNGDNDPASL